MRQKCLQVKIDLLQKFLKNFSKKGAYKPNAPF